MNTKKILLALMVTALLMGSVCAASVNNFKVDGYNNQYGSDFNSVYINDNGDSGVNIYKNAGVHYDIDDDDGYDLDDDDGYDYDDDYDLDDDDHYDYDGIDYDLDDNGDHDLDDMQITKNSDNTGYFTDYDDAEHGVVEVVQSGNDKYTVVFWAKDTSGINSSDLMAKLSNFNKDNGVAPVAF